MEKRKIEVCVSPALYPYYENPEAIVVVTDILRASSAIVTAFMNGVERIIPVGTLVEAKAFKEKGYMVAAERDQLDSSYTAIDTEAEVQGVTANSESLGNYLIGLPYPLHQAYDIGQDGEVSVHSAVEEPPEEVPIIKDPLPIIPIIRR